MSKLLTVKLLNEVMEKMERMSRMPPTIFVWRLSDLRVLFPKWKELDKIKTLTVSGATPLIAVNDYLKRNDL